jgi:hypothetical protein
VTATTPPRRLARLAAAAVAAGVVLAGGSGVPAPARALASSAVASSLSSPSVDGRQGCPTPDQPFTPRSVTIPRVVGSTRVLALGRDRNGVPRTPPLNDRGKWELGWDKLSHIRPGSPHGVVRMTAHTYPRDGSYGLALGNRLLTRLHKGALLVARGSEGQVLCYRVVQRVTVRAEQTLPAYYDDGGPPRLAILVCSGVRRGPGDWSHRTVWFAAPAQA